ncbi:MAG: helix-hairpin-helix domain-containing protein [Chitinophagales bacterium]|nr:helix-hairpin-helix domain-containing protein [Chitinophagales bacterium]
MKKQLTNLFFPGGTKPVLNINRSGKALRNTFLKTIYLVQFLLYFLIFFQPGHLYSQVTQPESEQKKEDLLEQTTERDESRKFDYENLVDLETRLIAHPIDLNTASRDELQQLADLRLLTDIQINALINYRDHLGPFMTIYELQAVPYLSNQDIKSILPLVSVNAANSENKITLRKLLFDGDYTLLVRGNRILEESKGYTPPDSSSITRYLGSPWDLYLRYRYSYAGKLSYGITAQKDAGEQFFKASNPYGFDFYSYHVFYTGYKLVKSVAVGDYSLKFGQGLITASGFGAGLSGQVLNIKLGGRTLRAYTSVNEFNFFRGVAAVIGTQHITFTPFFSFKYIDGNVGTVDTLAEDVFVTSVGGDGFHRTASEIADKNTEHQTVFGGNVDLHMHSLTIGASGIQTFLSTPLQRTYQPYNQFDFNGDRLADGAVHYDWVYHNFNLFGEAAMSDNGGKAFLSGLLVSVDPRVDVSILYRNYQKNFQSLYANAFAEGSTPANEKGIFTGISVRPFRGWKVDAFADIYTKSWLDYQIDAPSHGSSYFAQLTYAPNKVLEIYARWKDVTRQKNSPLDDQSTHYLIDVHKQNFRLNLSYKASAALTLKSRAEWSVVPQEGLATAHGFLAFQDVIYRRLGSPVQLTGRFCIFDVDNYDARIYTYESDVLYSYSVPAFFYRGTRMYFMVRYSFPHDIDLWIRAAQTFYSNLNPIGSGLDEIDKPTKSDFTVELRFRF